MFLSKIRAEAVDDRSPWGDFWFEPVSVRSSAGVHVSAETAMTLTAVYACVRILAETLAALPLCLYRPKKSGGRDLVTDHWLHELLCRRPNRYQDRFQWREMEQGHVALRGNGYNRIVAHGSEIDELIPLHPDRVKVELLPTGGYRYKLKQTDGQDEILAPSDIFKLCGISSNGLTGQNPIEIARESIGEGLAQQNFSARFFANDARPLGGWIEYGGKFGDNAKRLAFRDSWQAGQSGENRGKTAVLEDGMKYHEIGLNNKDSQFIEARKFKVSDIARIFRVPPHMIADLERATNNNIEWQSLEFIKFTMTPWAERWEAAIENQLLGEVDEDLEVEFDFDAMQRGDSKSRGEYYNLGVTGGWLTRNEVRAKEGLNPIDGLSDPLQPLNMAVVGEEPDPQPDPGQQEDAADARARAHALTLSIAGRVVRLETAALRKAYERLQGDPAAWDAWLEKFYGKHADYVAACLLCDMKTATAWCDRQLSELRVVVRQIGLEKTMPGMMDAWESNNCAAAELAANVQMSAQPRE